MIRRSTREGLLQDLFGEDRVACPGTRREHGEQIAAVERR
jgi:hypothetical protein